MAVGNVGEARWTPIVSGYEATSGVARVEYCSGRDAVSMSEESNQAVGADVLPARVLKLLAATQVLVNRLSGGRLGNKRQGHEVCFVTMTGAVTGRTLTKPVMYVSYLDGVLLVASVGGAPKNPAWYRNIITHPDIEVRHRRKVMRLRARLANEAERESLWPICDAAYPPYADYRSKTSRAIPILVCRPVDSGETGLMRRG
jgi:deazaflavin-dependent oxidoreductase (nitroreductase family)